ncbi:MAG: hypothetical protein ABI743_00520, partial [bacterium]
AGPLTPAAAPGTDWQIATILQRDDGYPMDSATLVDAGDRFLILTTQYNTTGVVESTTLKAGTGPGAAQATFSAGMVSPRVSGNTLWVLVQQGAGAAAHLEARDPLSLTLRDSWPLPTPPDIAGVDFTGALWQLRQPFNDGSLPMTVMGKATAADSHFQLRFALQRFDPATGTCTPGVLFDSVRDLDWHTTPFDGHQVLTTVRSTDSSPVRFVSLDWDTGATIDADLSDPRAAFWGRTAPALPHIEHVGGLERTYPVQARSTATLGEHPLLLGCDLVTIPRDSLDDAALTQSFSSLVSLTPHLRQDFHGRPEVTLCSTPQWSLLDGDGPRREPVPADLDASIRASVDTFGTFPCWLYTLDSQHVILTQLIAPQPDATDPLIRAGALRLGLMQPPSTTITWASQVALPPEFASLSFNPYVNVFAGPSALLVRVQSWSNHQREREAVPNGEPLMLECGIALPWPASWPQVSPGQLSDRALPSPER